MKYSISDICDILHLAQDENFFVRLRGHKGCSFLGCYIDDEVFKISFTICISSVLQQNLISDLVTDAMAEL